MNKPNHHKPNHSEPLDDLIMLCQSARLTVSAIGKREERENTVNCFPSIIIIILHQDEICLNWES